jgi:hypothetical protein
MNMTGALNPQRQWEAYLAALYYSNGTDALAKFLIPLLKREFFAVQPHLLPLYEAQEKEKAAAGQTFRPPSTSFSR